MFNRLPLEIWLYISEFVPNDDLYRQLRTLNSFFFHLAMDVKYRQVLIRWNAVFPTLPRIMNRLSDPFVTRRVRRVIVDYIFYPKAPMFRPASTARKDKMLAKIHAWTSSARRFLPPFDDHTARALKAIAKCISNLRHTVALEITTYFNNGANVSIPPKFMRHLTSAWSSIGANLQSLSIHTELLVYRELSVLHPHFPNLTELEIIIVPLSEYRNGDGNPGVGSHLGPNILAPFINNISPQLKKLSLIFRVFYHLPDVFRYLSTSLALESLKIQMTPMRGTGQSESGLKSFLCGGAHNLRELDLNIRTIYQCNLLGPTFCKLLLDCATDERCFSRLQTLKINPTRGKVGVDVLRASIQRASQTLKKLVIYDVELSRENALSIIDALSKCPNLVSLRLQIVLLDVFIVDSMAANLPGMRRLDLWHKVMTTDRLTPPLAHSSSRFRNRSYPEWKLEDVSIYFDSWAKADVGMMEALACSAPSIRSFCGRGHMGNVRKLVCFLEKE